MSPYEALGVQQDATAAQIKAAYRSKAQKAHPDKGGTGFEAIKEAYETLIDPQRRKRYDETGDGSRKQSIEDEARQQLINLFNAIIDHDHFGCDLIVLARQMVADAIKDAERQKAERSRKLNNLKQNILRVTTEADFNVWSALLASRIEAHTSAIAGAERHIAIYTRVKAMLDDYTDTKAPAPRPARTHTTSSATTGGGWF